jgi:hypothetical protein
MNVLRIRECAIHDTKHQHLPPNTSGSIVIANERKTSKNQRYSPWNNVVKTIYETIKVISTYSKYYIKNNKLQSFQVFESWIWYKFVRDIAWIIGKVLWEVSIWDKVLDFRNKFKILSKFASKNSCLKKSMKIKHRKRHFASIQIYLSFCL